MMRFVGLHQLLDSNILAQLLDSNLLAQVFDSNMLAQVPAAEPDASNGSGPDAGAPEPAAHGWQEAEGGRIELLIWGGGMWEIGGISKIEPFQPVKSSQVKSLAFCPFPPLFLSPDQ